MKYIDIHGHINFDDYGPDRDQAIRRAHDAGVGIITVGTGLKTSEEAVALADKYPDTWAIVGIHPTDTVSDMAGQEFIGIRDLARHPKVVAIGECGLDYFHSTPEDIPAQRALFEKHIALANEVGKPLMLHIRNAQHNSKGGAITIDPAAHNAYQEAIDLIKQHATVRANFHFFAGTVRDAQDIVEMGNTMSFTGVITFARNYDEVIRSVPLTHIMSETDCPYVAPIPHRGKRNEPSYVIETVKEIARIRGESLEVVASQLVGNAQKFFGIAV